MKVNNKSYIITFTLLIILLLSTGLLRVSIDIFNITGLLENIIFFFISFYFIAVAVIWILSINRRVLSIPFRKQYTLIGVYIILLLLSKIIKYRFCVSFKMERALWYFYYIPLLLIPVNAFLASMYLGKEERYHASRKWYFLFIPAVFLIALFVTNDHHELVFKIRSDEDYTRRALFYVAWGWILGLFLLTFANTFIKCKNIKSKRLSFIPATILIGSSALLIIASILDGLKIPKAFSFPDLISILIIIFLESLMSINLVRTNVGYVDFYNKTDIISVVTDMNIKPVYTTQSKITISQDDMVKLINKENSSNPHLELSYTNVNGGYFFFGVDIEDIIKLKESLRYAGISLDDENEILKAKNELDEKRIRIEKQSEIIDKINDLVKSDVIKLDEMINNLNDSNYEENVVKTFLPICYIKRRINLFLIYYNEKKLPSKELSFSLNEMLEYVKIQGIEAGFSVSDDLLGGYDIIYLFEEIYKIINYYLDIMKSVYISCYVKNNKNVAVVMVDHDGLREYKMASYSYADDTSTIKIIGGDIHD